MRIMCANQTSRQLMYFDLNYLFFVRRGSMLLTVHANQLPLLRLDANYLAARKKYKLVQLYRF